MFIAFSLEEIQLQTFYERLNERLFLSRLSLKFCGTYGSKLFGGLLLIIVELGLGAG